MVTSFVEAAKANGESLDDIIQFVSDVYHRNKSIGPKPNEDEDGWVISNLLQKNNILDGNLLDKNEILDSRSVFSAVGKKLSFEENHQANNYYQYQSQYDQNHQAMRIHQTMPQTHPMAATFTQNQNPQLGYAQQMLMMQNLLPNGQVQTH